MRAKHEEIKIELKKRMHYPIQEVGQWPKAVVTGYYRYFGVPDNSKAMSDFQNGIRRLWYLALRRRGQKGSITWKKMGPILERWIPRPQVYHKYPYERFGVII